MTDAPAAWVVPAAAAGARVDQFVAEHAPGLSRSQVRRAVLAGEVRVDDAPVDKPGQALREGQRVALSLAPRAPRAIVGEDIPLTVVYEDEAVLVVDKPAGLVVHPAPGHGAGTLVHALVHRFEVLAEVDDAPERPGIVHRIDKDTSGLVVIARTPEALAGLQAQFAAHSAHRRYRAVVFGPRLEDRGRIETLYGRHPRDRKRFSGRVAEGRRACTLWRVLARGEALAVLELALETGRTHQIRVHLSERGHPIVADPLYGRPAPRHGGGGAMARELAAARRMPRLALHAAELGFLHPTTGAPLRFGAADPPDLAALIAAVTG